LSTDSLLLTLTHDTYIQAAKEKAAQEKEAYQRQMSMLRGGSPLSCRTTAQVPYAKPSFQALETSEPTEATSPGADSDGFIDGTPSPIPPEMSEETALKEDQSRSYCHSSQRGRFGYK
jgi:hypothetical protein